MASSNNVIIQCFSFMLFAHLMADFVFQNKWMIDRKSKCYILLMHASIVTILTSIALGGFVQTSLLIGISHLIIDTAKINITTRFKQDNLLTFVIDQVAHMIVIAIAAIYLADSWTGGFWHLWLSDIIGPIVLANGFIIAVIVGNYITALTIKSYTVDLSGQGLQNAGQLIGWLEHMMIFLLLAIDEAEGIAFLIAAKSFLRFEAVKEQEVSEYVLIGTLTSFGWALSVSVLTFALYERL